MKLIICTIYDMAVQSHGQPFFARANGEAIRIFVDEVNNPGSRINKHPSDFELYKIGTYEDFDAAITTMPIERLARAQDYTETK